MLPVQNIAGYKFAPLADLPARRSHLQLLCKTWDLKGTILLSPEGLNFFVAGRAAPIDQLLTEFRTWPGLHDLEAKFSETDHQPFRRMLVRLKREIIAFGVEGIEPGRRTSPKMSPAELKRLLDAGEPVTLLDTRNDYEVRLGTFKNALPIGISHFREFPIGVEKLPPELKNQPIVMFCTGGIRCEKAGPFMEGAGFSNVHQLDGGILKYFEECGGAHFEGECFVFDQRVGVDPALQETGSLQCYKCQTPLSESDQRHEHYRPGESCPHCYKSPAEQMAATLARRQLQIAELCESLPGSQPYDHVRPVNIPARGDGQRLIDVLCGLFTHVPAPVWEERFAAGLICDADGHRVDPTKAVRSGERYQHNLAAVIEPEVNMRIEVLYEDEALIVINKPAPLPMHAGGRFFRNTLKYVLDEVYYPQKPRPCHRLDANTTGVVVIARTRHFAGLVQPQFARGEVDKVYLVRVQGHPPRDEFTCDAPISAEPGALGSRTVDHLKGLPAQTAFRVLSRFGDGTALIEARPRTGRTNQIRVHLWHLGFPICGDQTYLAENGLGESQTLDVGAGPLCLHAWHIELKHPVSGIRVRFSAAQPEWAMQPEYYQAARKA